MSIPLLFLALTRLAAATTDAPRSCAGGLDVPEQYHEQFEAYAAPQFLPNFGEVKLERSGDYTFLKMNTEPHADFDDPSATEASFQLHRDERDPRKMSLEVLNFPDRLDSDFVLRVAVAHFLEAHPRLERVDLDFNGLPDYGPLRGRLSRGESPAAAFRATEAFRAFAAFGFDLETAQDFFIGQTEPRDLILRMRVKRKVD